MITATLEHFTGTGITSMVVRSDRHSEVGEARELAATIDQRVEGRYPTDVRETNLGAQVRVWGEPSATKELMLEIASALGVEVVPS